MPRNKKDNFHKRLSAVLPYLWPALAVAAGLYLLLAPSQPTTVADSSIQAVSARNDIEQVSLSRDVTLHATRNIEYIRVGDRVLAANPEITEEERANWGEPDWTDWQHVELEMTQADGGVLHVSMIRPREWFSLNRVEQGAEIFLDLPEMGVWGSAKVVSISACPQIRSGSGQVVTATFAHPPSTAVLDVRFEGDSKAIGVTDNHLFWSADREEFIAIGQMEIGERVLTYSGETKRLAQKLPRPGPQLVYNLEVYGEHVYFVGEQGLLVHNQYGDGLDDLASAGTGLVSYDRRFALSQMEPAEIRFTVSRRATQNMSVQQRDAFVRQLQEQEDVLNVMSLRNTEDLEFNLLNYGNLNDAGLIDITRAQGAQRLSLRGTGQDAAHGLDAIAGGYPYFIIGGRDPVQRTIGSLWRTRVNQIQPGRRHRLVPVFTE